MKKRAICAALCLALCVALGGHAAAAESGVSFLLDGTVLETEIPAYVTNQTTYVAYWPIVKALYPDAEAVWANGRAEVRAEGLELYIKPGASYIEANGRCLYVPNGVQLGGVNILVPVRVLGEALGAEVTWNEERWAVELRSGTAPIRSGEDYYQEDVVYWLSRIIHAESGNQPLEGKIAVGNVVLNRVRSPRFPDTVYEVIFQRNQFTPAMTGTVNRTPSSESVIAAKLCLEGVNTAGDALYFVNPHVAPSSWASRNRPYVATIGAHAFFG